MAMEANARSSRVLAAVRRRLSDTVAKAAGREPYLSWNQIWRDWLAGFRVLAAPAWDEVGVCPPDGVHAQVAPIGEGGSTAEESLVILPSGERIYWPASYGLEVLGQVYRELGEGDPHNYFDLYCPSEGDVVFDVGSCEGLFALRAARLGAHVYAFEPLKELADSLRMTFRAPLAVGRVEVHELAFAAEPGEATFMVNGERPECSTTDVDLSGYDDASGFKAYAMTVDTIDAFVERQAMSRVDCIKMDIEAAELSALQGARKTLESMRPELLIALYHRPEDVADIPAFLATLGYVVTPGALTYYPAVRLTGRTSTPRPHYRPHIVRASHVSARRRSSTDTRHGG